ncbi:MAG TPA: 6,7-dimethyl-8-ribityllumazine synthase, partial [Ignavibacteriaceae bacterium]|nr:6,7-dimethyl-8-ribityllumazine synthase [Ignavibacteriaceae bacterium]
MNIIEGNPAERNFNFAIVVSRFNEFITERLLEGAKNCFIDQGYDENKIDVVKVPGAFEIPITASHLASSKKYSAIICLGAVIRGSTPHFEYVSMGVTNGISRVALDHRIPVIFGVL